MKGKKKWAKRLLAFVLVCGMLPWSSIPVLAEGPENLALSATASATDAETTNSAGNAIDGNLATHWGTNQNKAANEAITLTWNSAQTIKQVDIYFERDDAGQNILSYKVELFNDGEQAVYTYTKDEKAKQQERIVLEQSVTAKKLVITILTANEGTLKWLNAGINEIEVYSEECISLNEAKERMSAQIAEIPDKISDEKFPVPELSGQNRYTVEINGADFEQIVANDGTIHHPLTDKTVKISFRIMEGKKEVYVTGDYTYTIQGTCTQAENKNAKPSVIPEIQEWYSDSTKKLEVNTLNKVVYDDAKLLSVVEEFIADYEEFTGITLTKEQSKEKKSNAFNFSMTAPDKLLGEEGYTMNISDDRINVASESVVGNMYGMQTILQMYKSDDSGFPVGQMRDYPRFSVRGFVFDVARKPVSLEMIKDIARTMRYYKMNDFQVHLSDNYIWLEDYGIKENEDEGYKAYEAFRLESGVSNEDGETPTAKDYSISKADFRSFIQEQRAVGVNIVPEIDLPAHANSFTKVWPELKISNQVSSGGHSLIDHLNITDETAIEKIKEIFDDYTKKNGDVPATFDSETTVHIGADEFLTNYGAYRSYLNTIIPYVKETNTVRMWGGLTKLKDNPVTQIQQDAIENVEINLWSKDWADGMEMYNMGYKLINTIDDYGYMVPDGSKTRANSYGDLLNVSRVFASFEPNLVRTGNTNNQYQYIPSGDDQALGAAFAIWNDNIDKRASGLTESDLYWRFFDAMPFYAEKTWAATGKEKGTEDALSTLAQTMGTGPNTNPYYEEESVNGVYESYDFNGADGLSDTSENKRNLTLPEDSSAEIKDQALSLKGETSYVTTPIRELGNGNALSFDITLNEIARPGQILFESDAAYGTHDIRIMEDGKLGFTRELYNYYFDYELPVGTTVNIQLVTEQQVTKLYVNGTFVSNATGKFIHNDMEKKTGITNATFALPLERIGSKTNAVAATIDNVCVTETSGADKYGKGSWTGETDSEATNDTKGGSLKYAFDGNSDTIWHTNWNKTPKDELTGTNSFYAQIDFGKTYTINQFSFTPRQDKVSGRVTKADLWISKDGENWTKFENSTFADDAKTKTFYFPEQEVRYVKFIAKKANDEWVAVSEFDINNAPKTDCTIYVETGKGGSVSGGTRVDAGTEVTVTASPKSGFEFAGWYDNLGNKVSDFASYTFTADKNYALEAKFQCNITPEISEPIEEGESSGDASDTSVGWKKGDLEFSTNIPAEFASELQVYVGEQLLTENRDYYLEGMNTRSALDGVSVVLTEGFLKTLEAGTYTLKVKTELGDMEQSFSVAKEQTTTPSTPGNEGNGNENTGNSNNSNNNNNNNNNNHDQIFEENQNTGISGSTGIQSTSQTSTASGAGTSDPAVTVLWCMLLCVAIVGGFITKKRRNSDFS